MEGTALSEQVTGRALDAKVAERVFEMCPHEWTPITKAAGRTRARRWRCTRCVIEEWGSQRTFCPLYSSTWEGLGLVVERMRELGWAWTMDYQLGSKFYTTEFWAHGKEPWGWAKANKAPEAVCLAALDALGEGAE